MSLLQAAPAPSLPPGEGRSQRSSSSAGDFMSEDEPPPRKLHRTPLAAHDDARALVRLIQCRQCSKPFRNPVNLPCGNSLCRSCVPETYQREGVSYPDLPGRRRGFVCPFPDCGEEHVLADCSIDVTLSKIMEAIAQLVAVFMTTVTTSGDSPLYIEEVVAKEAEQDDEDDDAMQDMERPRNWTRPGGRLLATYSLTDDGILEYQTEVVYQTLSASGDSYRSLDDALMAQLIETTQKELDCQVCYALMLNPVTTPCGHTLCRNCLMRVLDHSLHCPVCRRTVTISPTLQGHPNNKTLVNLMNALCPDLVVQRAEAAAAEEAIGSGDLDTPLFVCTLGFPGCPTFLRIFEPRYRLMIRRALEGNRQFGMLMYNSHGVPQGELGNVQFLEYGTMLRIENVQMLPDGQSIIETKGIYRFRVKRHGQIDGYTIGNVERVEDMPLAEEERLEAEETSPDLPQPADSDIEGQISRMSTRALLMTGLEFIILMRQRSAPWLHQRILDAYGGAPDDAAIFPYWFASIIPISEDAKYQLLQTTSVRQRLKVTALWIKQMERQRWYVRR